MASPGIETVLAMSRQYGCQPSEILFLDDEYTAYCFNEACFFIMMMLMNGKKPHYKKEQRKHKQRHYKTFSEFYKQYE